MIKIIQHHLITCEDWATFSFLQRVLAVIDIILNPKATDWPFLSCNIADSYELPKNHWVIKQFNKEDKHWVWCIRWNKI